MSTQAVTPNQTPPLNDLVTKIRGAHPGAYDDIDDATLTKKVLAKYPQYSDLAAPKMTVGAPSNTKVESPEGPIAQGLTTLESKIADVPKNAGQAIKEDAHIQATDPFAGMRQKHSLSELNPIDTKEGNLPMNIGGTAFNLLPYAVDIKGGGIGESPIGQVTKGIAKAGTESIRPVMRAIGSAGKSIGNSLDPDVVGLVSPRAASGLRLASKVGKVATKLGTPKEIPAPEGAESTKAISQPIDQKTIPPIYSEEPRTSNYRAIAKPSSRAELLEDLALQQDMRNYLDKQGAKVKRFQRVGAPKSVLVDQAGGSNPVKLTTTPKTRVPSNAKSMPANIPDDMTDVLIESLRRAKGGNP